MRLRTRAGTVRDGSRPGRREPWPVDRRLTRLRVLVDRLERLPASARREGRPEEARARMVAVETGDHPRAPADARRTVAAGAPPDTQRPRRRQAAELEARRCRGAS